MTQLVVKMLLEQGHNVKVLSNGVPTVWPFPEVEILIDSRSILGQECRRDLFYRFDKIINLPGGGLQQPDPRMRHILADIEMARALRVPYCLSGHSICRDVPADVLRKVDLLLTREPVSSRLLESMGVPHVATVDPAWSDVPPESTGKAETVVMLRWDGRAGIDDDKGWHWIEGHVGKGARPVFSTSDAYRDEALGVKLAYRFGGTWMPCVTLNHLFARVGSAEHLITDRYHPAILASLLGVRLNFLGANGNRDDGLRELFLRDLNLVKFEAKAGLAVLAGWANS